MSLSFITTHVALALDRIIEQYKGKPKIEGLISAHADRVQTLENVFKALNEERTVDAAIGAQLDGAGDIVGIARVTGETDDEYRFNVKAKIVQNINQATPEEFIAAAIYFIGGNGLINYTELYPAAVGFFTDQDIPEENRLLIKSKLEKFLPTAVTLNFYGHFDTENPFLFDTGNGFGDTDDPELGGLLADLY